MTRELTIQDYNGLQKALLDWADSYDKKDWKTLRSNIAPTLMVDYTGIGLQKWENMSADEYMAMIQDPNFVGDPCTMTQHLVGATHYEKLSDTETIGRHQIRAAHQVYTGPDLQTVKLKGHAHASNVHHYRKIDGVWKFAGIKPTVLWSEYDFWSVWNRPSQAWRRGGVTAYFRYMVGVVWKAMTAGFSRLRGGKRSERRD